MAKWTWFKQLDSILRGEATDMAALEEGKISLPVTGVGILTVGLAIFFGLCMGSFAMIRTEGQAVQQMMASAAKLPLLFFLTLAITFPSLYVFNALIGSRLSVLSALRLLVAAMGVMLAVMASLGPIIVFFAASTTSYPFMKLLNVAAGMVGGILGIAFLLRTLHRLTMVQDRLEFQRLLAKKVESEESASSHMNPENPPPLPGTPENSTTPPSALDLLGNKTHEKSKSVFRIWIFVFGLVGAQMSWVLRPFIGSPDMQFQWFRARESNFFMAVLQALRDLVS